MNIFLIRTKSSVDIVNGEHLKHYHEGLSGWWRSQLSCL